MIILLGVINDVSIILPKLASEYSSYSEGLETIQNMMIPVDEDIINKPQKITLLFCRSLITSQYQNLFKLRDQNIYLDSFIARYQCYSIIYRRQYHKWSE